MKKLAILLGVLSLVACTDQKVVNYNTARLDVIEDYLRNHKYVKPSENLDKLIEEGKIEYAEEYDKMQAEKAKEQPQTVTEVVGENGEVEEVAVAPKKAEKDMTESERMDVEVQRIKKRMLEINDKIENYNKTNEMIDNLEKNVGELERKVNY